MAEKEDWEDVGGSMSPSGRMGSAGGGGGGGGGGGNEPFVPGISDAVTSAMVNHFAQEITKGSTNFLPAFLASARRYFNVSHGYVLKKCLWQLVPTNSLKKKSSDGELGAEKDWTARVYEGLEVDIEEPDLYIPTMGFVTYVLLCGIIRGLQDSFHPDVISSNITFATVALVLETGIAKAILFTGGAVNTPTLDLAILLGYKFFYLSLHLIFGLFLGWGHKPSGFIFSILALGLLVSCCVALWQSLRRLARMQPSVGQECVSDIHKLIIKALPVGQVLIYYCLLPTWPPPAQLAALSDLADTPLKMAVANASVAGLH